MVCPSPFCIDGQLICGSAGFDWHALPRGSVVVDVGGGIGSTSMFLAHAFSNPTDEDSIGLKFIIQDRPIVVEMGERQWRSKCPELLDPDIAQFQGTVRIRFASMR